MHCNSSVKIALLHLTFVVLVTLRDVEEVKQKVLRATEVAKSKSETAAQDVLTRKLLGTRKQPSGTVKQRSAMIRWPNSRNLTVTPAIADRSEKPFLIITFFSFFHFFFNLFFIFHCFSFLGLPGSPGPP